jgi:hypothetical protein
VAIMLLDYYIPMDSMDSEMQKTTKGRYHIRDLDHNHYAQNAKHLMIKFRFVESSIPRNRTWDSVKSEFLGNNYCRPVYRRRYSDNHLQLFDLPEKTPFKGYDQDRRNYQLSPRETGNFRQGTKSGTARVPSTHSMQRGQIMHTK